MKPIPVLAALGLMMLAACSSEGATSRSATPSSTIAPTPADSGTGTLHGHIVGDTVHPGYTVEVPAGWSTQDGGFMIKEGVPTLGMSVWDVGLVPSDPCRWEGTETDTGTTVDDLVVLLVAQRHRNATVPESITVDGHEGVYLEWTVPVNAVVTADADFKGCDAASDDHRYFFSWWGADAGGRYQQEAGQLDRLWVLDVGGQTLVIDATSVPASSEADILELEQVVASLRFAEA